jgi:hypothetical protein
MYTDDLSHCVIEYKRKTLDINSVFWIEASIMVQ